MNLSYKKGISFAFALTLIFALGLSACEGSSNAGTPGATSTPPKAILTSTAMATQATASATPTSQTVSGASSTTAAPAATAASTPLTASATPSAAAIPSTGGQATQTAGSNQTIVHMMGLEFVPKNSTIAAGTTVVWKNTSKLSHTVEAVDGSFKSGNIAPGATFQHTFNTPGEYPYFCKYHGKPNGQGMFGTITVK